MVLYRNRKLWLTAFAGYMALLFLAGEHGVGLPNLMLALLLVVPGFAWGVLRCVARQSRGSYRTFWHLISTGCLFYFLAQFIWNYYAWTGGEPPVPSVADVLWNGQTLLFIAAICYLMAKERSVFQGVKVAIDAFLILLVVGAAMWEFYMEPHMDMLLEKQDWVALASVAIYPVSDSVIVFCLLFIGYAYRGLFAPKVQGFFTAGLLLFVLGDIMYMNDYTVGTDTGSWMDLAYAFALFAIAAGGIYSLGGKEHRVRERTRNGWGESLRYLLPYGVASILLVLPLLRHDHEDRFEVHVANGIIVGLIMLRQAFVMIENRSLLWGTSRLLNETSYLANHDTVTGLPNRMHFERKLAEALTKREPEDGERIALLFLDLDRFKYINDSYGHDIGDDLLREIAARLQIEAAEGGHLVSRRGGDEFTVLLRGVRVDKEIGEWVERFMRRVTQPIVLDGGELLTGASIGIAVFPQDARTAADLLRNADAAMYKAKAMGGGRHCFFTEDLDRSFTRTATLEHSLRRALERGEFVLHYQPMYEAASGRLVGTEALLRWQRKGTLVSPAEFIPLAEETGLIVPVGEWALREACRYAKRWLEAFPEPFEISVNVSPIQFRQPNFEDRVLGILRETGLPPEALVLEITESIMRDDEAIRKLECFKAHGVNISLDDFGTGYSSLSDLHQLPIDALKIAQNFTKDVLNNEKQGRIVKAIVALAKSLDLLVVAEGVETEEQFLFMYRLGCDVIQGYYFSKPLPEAELWAKAGRPAS